MPSKIKGSVIQINCNIEYYLSPPPPPILSPNRVPIGLIDFKEALIEEFTVFWHMVDSNELTVFGGSPSSVGPYYCPQVVPKIAKIIEKPPQTAGNMCQGSGIEVHISC